MCPLSQNFHWPGTHTIVEVPTRLLLLPSAPAKTILYYTLRFVLWSSYQTNIGIGREVGAAIRVLIGDKDDKETDSFCTLADRHYRESVFVPMVTCIMPHHLPLPPQNLLIIMKSPEWPAYLCTIEVPSRSQIIVQFEKSGMLISYFYNIVIIVSSNWLGRCYCWMVPSTTTSTMRSLKSS